jgi:hypothetical protein
MMFSCFATKEVFANSRRIDSFGRVNSWRRSHVPRIPGENFGTSEKVTQKNCYKMCKEQCNNHTEEEATWYKEDQLKAEFPDMISNLSKSRG